MSPPSSLSAEVYVSCAVCVLLLALFSCLQVYTNRLRRVITAFYHPKVQTQTQIHETHPPVSKSKTRHFVEVKPVKLLHFSFYPSRYFHVFCSTMDEFTECSEGIFVA
ncbi:hypothetical protein XENOCAPTIV_025614 [Xenoophorus captivus]|uniref:Dendritic cell-specific transmembrane protein-like domain-containing protein n=1 Tax=Xenoophorus captivus TaxID=1517983 RepID=A0ABV0RAP0_9TELE